MGFFATNGEIIKATCQLLTAAAFISLGPWNNSDLTGNGAYCPNCSHLRLVFGPMARVWVFPIMHHPDRWGARGDAESDLITENSRNVSSPRKNKMVFWSILFLFIYLFFLSFEFFSSSKVFIWVFRSFKVFFFISTSHARISNCHWVDVIYC